MTQFPSPFPWDEAMRFGLGMLRLSPREFWAMTPRELAAAAGAHGGAFARLQRTELADLMKRYPDGAER